MTNQELKERITEKFLSILHKLSKLIVDDLTKETFPQFRFLISGCMEIMERNNISFSMNKQQREFFNSLFIGVGSRCRIAQRNSNGGIIYESYNDNIEQLVNDYNVLEQVDNFLSAIERTNKVLMIKDFVFSLFSRIGINRNYRDEEEND
ncbi:MAG: hypothetical protein IJ752_06855 [Alphaproteobacteria bacterium]|nr:hypothetical protein [Alphaproteobacteria bacterium]